MVRNVKSMIYYWVVLIVWWIKFLMKSVCENIRFKLWIGGVENVDYNVKVLCDWKIII